MKYAIAYAALLVIATPALGHSWYPASCCSGDDCAPVDSMTLASPEYWSITSKHGTVLVSIDMPTRASQDGAAHVCISKNPVSGTLKPLCLFLPPNT